MTGAAAPPPAGVPRRDDGFVAGWVLALVMAAGALAARVVAAPPQWPDAALHGSALLRALAPHGFPPMLWLPFALWVAAALAAARRLLDTSWHGWAAAGPAWVVRLTAYAGFSAVAAATAFAAATGAADVGGAPAFAAAWVASALGSLLIGALCLRPTLLAPPVSAVARVIDVAVFNLVVLLLVAEALVVAVGSRSSSPLFHFDALAGAGASEEQVRDNVRRFRFRPGTEFFDTRLNSRGYVDEEPFVATDRDFVAVLLADSFGTGPVVPYARNFATVAERRLQAALAGRFERVAVHNLGIAWIGVPEYYYLLLTEALPLRPSAVVLCIFVGNDFDRFIVTPRQASGRLLLENWRSVQLARRLLRLRQERRAGSAELLGAQTSLPRGLPAYLDDPGREPATFSPERFLAIERERLVVCDTADPNNARRYAGMEESLAQFARVLGDRLLVVLIPDEFQVNDALWGELLRGDPRAAALDRELPQRRLGAFCGSAGIAVLDLLPRLRAANRQQHVYHLRDTHWNSLGHRLAGEAIAERIVNSMGRSRDLPSAPE